jgi:hypothetical protein
MKENSCLFLGVVLETSRGDNSLCSSNHWFTNMDIRQHGLVGSAGDSF